MIVICSAVSSSDGRQPPKLPGVTEIDGEWKLELDYYRKFIEEVTGVEVTDEVSPNQLKTIQSRLEGCVASYKQSGDCLCTDLSSYEHLDSMTTVHELSRFFRVLVADRIESQPPV